MYIELITYKDCVTDDNLFILSTCSFFALPKKRTKKTLGPFKISKSPLLYGDDVGDLLRQATELPPSLAPSSSLQLQNFKNDRPF